MEWGGKSDTLDIARKALGLESATKPEVTRKQDWFLEVFSEIHTERPYIVNEAGAFPQMLPVEGIESYRKSLALEEIFSRPEFFKMIRTLDRLWMQAYNAKQEKAKASKPKKPAKTPVRKK